ncbi:MAG TPA: DUF6364 family protein [Daejeonella sp.]|nr:DUF6364 family protein [Daejeonella sp.]
MDSKITLSFNRDIIQRAKKYAADNHISLSRLIEHLLKQVTNHSYKSLEDFPISDWVSQVAEGEVEYKRARKTSRKTLKDEFFNAKK